MRLSAGLALAGALAALAAPGAAQAQVTPDQAKELGREAYRYWLPAPAAGFRLSMRLYWPKPAVLRGDWGPPPLERLP